MEKFPMPAPTSDIIEKPWVEQVIVPGAVSIDAPWPLESRNPPLPPEAAKVISRLVRYEHAADGLHVAASVVSSMPGVPGNLDGAADGALGKFKTVPGTRSVDGKKREKTVLGARAIELEARIEMEQGGPLQFHSVVLLRGSELIQVTLVTQAEGAPGARAWEKLRDSIRVPAPA
jgi:hypothetical protein